MHILKIVLNLRLEVLMKKSLLYDNSQPQAFAGNPIIFPQKPFQPEETGGKKPIQHNDLFGHNHLLK